MILHLDYRYYPPFGGVVTLELPILPDFSLNYRYYMIVTSTLTIQRPMFSSKFLVSYTLRKGNMSLNPIWNWYLDYYGPLFTPYYHYNITIPPLRLQYQHVRSSIFKICMSSIYLSMRIFIHTCTVSLKYIYIYLYMCVYIANFYHIF